MREIMDRRVIKTKKAIRNAYLTLNIEKDTSKITIKEIADLADVDRKTVYNYYKSVEDILGEIENELIAHFEEAAQELDGERDPKMYFVRLAELVEKDMEMYELLMRSDNSTFVTKAVVVLNSWIQRALGKSGMMDADKMATATEYVTAGIFCAYRRWFRSDRKKSLHQFSVELYELVMHGLPSYFLS